MHTNGYEPQSGNETLWLSRLEGAVKTPSAGIEMSCPSVESFHKKLTVPPGAIVTCAGLQTKTLGLSTPTVADRGLVFPVGGVEVAPGARVGGWVAAETDIAVLVV